MKYRHLSLLTCCSIFLFTSCARTLSVFQGDNRAKGIPFYQHKGVVQQKTKYLFEWRELTFVKEKTNGGDQSILAKVRVKASTDYSAIQDAVDRLSSMAGEAIPPEVKKIVGQLEAIHDGTLLQSTNITTNNVVENNWSVKTVVDYSTKYTLNSKIPWLGSSTVSQKLAANGSLTEVSGTTDSQIDDLVGAAVSLAAPIATVRVAEIQASSNFELAELGTLVETMSQTYKGKIPGTIGQTTPFLFQDIAPQEKYSLKVEEKGYLYTFTQNHDIASSGPLNSYTPIAFNLRTGNFTRENWPVKAKGKTEDNASTIKVSGNIQLPESKE